MNAPVNLLLHLMELKDVTARGIFSLLLQHLQAFGMTKECMIEYSVSCCLVQLWWLGNHTGVKKLMKERFPCYFMALRDPHVRIISK
jgi:hypothetical protein